MIALGGSIVHPDEINVAYLKEFKNFISTETAKGKKFIIVVGGGAPARKFQRAANEVVDVADNDLDWLGIHATRLNAHLLRTIFREEAHPVILDERGRINDFAGHAIIIGAGWQPGWSTDFVAAQAAADFNIKMVLILGKPEFVYNKDNEQFSDAEPIKELSWPEYLKLIPNVWSPGIHAPVDPVAAKLAEKEGLEVIVAGGADLANVKNILEGEKFKGTVIKS